LHGQFFTKWSTKTKVITFAGNTTNYSLHLSACEDVITIIHLPKRRRHRREFGGLFFVEGFFRGAVTIGKLWSSSCAVSGFSCGPAAAAASMLSTKYWRRLLLLPPPFYFVLMLLYYVMNLFNAKGIENRKDTTLRSIKLN
jgi:hypothetical protein